MRLGVSLEFALKRPKNEPPLFNFSKPRHKNTEVGAFVNYFPAADRYDLINPLPNRQLLIFPFHCPLFLPQMFI